MIKPRLQFYRLLHVLIWLARITVRHTYHSLLCMIANIVYF